MRKKFGEGIFFSSEEKKMETEKRKFLGEGKCHDDRHTHSNFEEGTRIVDSELAIIIIFPKTLKSWASVYRQVWECWSGKHINVGIGDKADLWTYGLVITNTLWIEYMVFFSEKKNKLLALEKNCYCKIWLFYFRNHGNVHHESWVLPQHKYGLCSIKSSLSISGDWDLRTLKQGGAFSFLALYTRKWFKIQSDQSHR